ncbi:hypothetical protein GCM10010172_04090 [Paractinoplanes ferrugineus]|uniref:Peptidase C14 caspase domain-containing protein n=1 Tax=Paractinoplanes ferrugineus TaxID=113564 RepID=A0A919J554_9ACTN|nr:hypothetical protein Afe05nite_56540 [Actinoplanes ferrugineus]
MARHALLLGTVTCHLDPELAPLPSVRQDVLQLKAVLDDAGEFDTVRPEFDLPLSHMVQILEEFYGSRRKDDTALLYYSGHGVLHQDGQSLFWRRPTPFPGGSMRPRWIPMERCGICSAALPPRKR